MSGLLACVISPGCLATGDDIARYLAPADTKIKSACSGQASNLAVSVG